MLHLTRNSLDDWHVEVRATTPPLRFGPVTGYQATVYRPDGTIQDSRHFRSPHAANQWALSWGLPRRLTEQV